MNETIDSVARTWGLWMLDGIVPAAMLAAVLLVLERTPWRPPARWCLVLWVTVVLRPFWPLGLEVPGALAPTATKWITDGDGEPRRPPAGNTRTHSAPGARGAMQPGESSKASASELATPDSFEPRDIPPDPTATRTPAVARLSPGAVFVLLWAAGFLAWLSARSARTVRLRRRLNLRPPPSGHMLRMRRWLQESGLSPASRILVTSITDTPLVVGVLRPTIVLPHDLLDSESLRAIVLHEAVHVRRRDPVLVAAVCAARWFQMLNPAVWLAAGRIRTLVEDACDEEVCRRLGDPQAYARALLEVSERITTRTAAIAFPESTGSSRLARRIHHVLSPRLRYGRAHATGIALAWLGLATVSLPARENGDWREPLPVDAAPGAEEGTDRAVSLELPGGGLLVADAVGVEPSGISRLVARPGRMVELRIPRHASLSGPPERHHVLLGSAGAEVRAGDEGHAIDLLGPVRLEIREPSVSAEAATIRAELRSAEPPLTAQAPGVRVDREIGHLPESVIATRVRVHLKSGEFPISLVAATVHMELDRAPQGENVVRFRAGAVQADGSNDRFHVHADRVLGEVRLLRSPTRDFSGRRGNEEEREKHVKLSLEGHVRVTVPGASVGCHRVVWRDDGTLRCEGGVQLEHSGRNAQEDGTHGATAFSPIRKITTDEGAELLLGPPG